MMKVLKGTMLKLFMISFFIGVLIAPLKAQKLSVGFDSASSYEQIVVDKGMELSSALSVIEEKFDVVFLYRSETIRNKKVKQSFLVPPQIEESLTFLLQGHELVFTELNPKTYGIEKPEVKSEPVSIAHQVSGEVRDASSGEVMPGVNVKVKNEPVGTISGKDGRFSLEAPSPQDTLEFTFLGYAKQVIPINGRSRINVEMETQLIEGEELVVVGYGSENRKDVTGSIGTVELNDKESKTHNSVSSLLKGKTAGVVVKASSGQPGSTVDVKIRGISSLQGDNQPLYVVDGVIMNSASDQTMDTPNGEFGTNKAPQDALTGINPSDIKDIQILKDASATAIYGSRGSNGVVLITTKTGKPGETNIEYSGSTTVGQVSNNMDMLNAFEYAQYQNEAAQIAGQGDKYFIDEENRTIRAYVEGSTPEDSLGPPAQPINWQDDIMKTSISQSHRVSISGATDKTNYFLAVGYNKQEGVIKQTGLSQGDFRLNLDRDIGDRFSVKTRFSGMFRKNNQTKGANAATGGTRFSIIRQMLSKAPMTGNFQEEEDFDLGLDGPRAWLAGYDDISDESRFIGSIKAKYELTNDINYILRLGGTIRNKNRKTWYGTELNIGQKTNGLAERSEDEFFGYNVDNIFRMRKTLGEKHNLETTLVATFDRRIKKQAAVQGQDFFSESLRADGISFANVIYPYYLNDQKISVMSGLARFNYRFNNNYLLTFSVRADGSSKFSSGNKWGYFPSAAFAWRAGNEKFIKKLDLFSELKFRVGWGITGSQSVRPYQTITPYAFAPYPDGDNNIETGVGVSQLANDDLTWESTEQYNAGIDFGFWGNRLSGSIDAYYKQTEDLLQQISLGPSSGFNQFFVNRGSIENKGIEVTLDGAAIQKKDFALNIGGNISFNRNKVLDLGLPTSVFGGQEREAFLGENVSGGSYFKTPANIFMVGQPVGVFWGFETNGIITNDSQLAGAPTYQGTAPQKGDILYVDQNGDGNIDPQDKRIIGDPNPDYSFGLNATASYKNWQLEVYVNGIQGFDVANGNLLREGLAEGNSSNVRSETYFDAWREGTNEDGKYPRIGYNYKGGFPDRIVEDGSFVRLSNVTLSYSVPTSKIAFIRNLNVYATGLNLMTLTSYSGWDPENTAYPWDGSKIGVDYNTYPRTRSVVLGVNIKF